MRKLFVYYQEDYNQKTNKMMIIKEKSVIEFFNQNVTDFDRKLLDSRCEPSGHILFQKEIYLKNDCSFSPGANVQFELEDRGRYSSAIFKCIYTYEAQEYDSINAKLVLKSFKIEQIDGIHNQNT